MEIGKKVISYRGAQLQDEKASTIVSMVHLEALMLEYIYGQLDPYRLHLELAEVAVGLQLSFISVSLAVVNLVSHIFVQIK